MDFVFNLSVRNWLYQAGWNPKLHFKFNLKVDYIILSYFQEIAPRLIQSNIRVDHLKEEESNVPTHCNFFLRMYSANSQSLWEWWLKPPSPQIIKYPMNNWPYNPFPPVSPHSFVFNWWFLWVLFQVILVVWQSSCMSSQLFVCFH